MKKTLFLSQELENLLSLLDSPNSENLPLGLALLPLYEKELLEVFGCSLEKLKDCVEAKKKFLWHITLLSILSLKEYTTQKIQTFNGRRSEYWVIMSGGGVEVRTTPSLRDIIITDNLYFFKHLNLLA